MHTKVNTVRTFPIFQSDLQSDLYSNTAKAKFGYKKPMGICSKYQIILFRTREIWDKEILATKYIN